MLMLILIMCS